MKNILYGDGENDPIPEQVVQLATEMVNTDLLLVLIEKLDMFEFEVFKRLRKGKKGCCSNIQ
jgi:calcium binding protein 39